MQGKVAYDSQHCEWLLTMMVTDLTLSSISDSIHSFSFLRNYSLANSVDFRFKTGVELHSYRGNRDMQPMKYQYEQ